jgi:hypothetical protein
MKKYYLKKDKTEEYENPFLTLIRQNTPPLHYPLIFLLL